ncbi:MAG: ATP-binding cassette domain-containing protein [Bacillota bacterium]|nr:ATP-binding cassette domain-containing protein [Bacillota bacterium]MDI3317477.1 ATP-binding cassette domain-containing protein [Bacillota bacterium]
MGDVIEVERLERRYGAVEAVRGVSFTVRAREIFAFLGPNGAGKTTTIKMLATLLDPSGGRATVAGHDVVRERARVREAIGIVFQDPTLDDQLTAMENLVFHGLLYGLSERQVRERALPLLRLSGLEERAQSLVRTFSGGMKRRLELVRGLIHTPEVLFLDEPTVGLDPQSRAQMWELVRGLARDGGVTVFMTTHYMDEAEVADRIAIMDDGRIVALDTPDGLKRQVGSDIILVEADEPPADPHWAEGLGVELRGGAPRFEVRCQGADRVLPRVVEAFTGVRRVEVRRPTLDTVFLTLTGREIREEPPEDPRRRRARWGR